MLCLRGELTCCKKHTQLSYLKIKRAVKFTYRGIYIYIYIDILIYGETDSGVNIRFEYVYI